MIKKTLYTSLVLASFYIPLNAANHSKETGPDHMALATMMIYDGKYDKATKELDEVDKNGTDFDAAKYATMRGIIALKAEIYPEAIKEFNDAVAKTKVKVYLPPKTEEEKKKKHLLSFVGLHFEKKKKVVLPEFDPEAIRKDKLEQLYLYLSQSYYKNKQYLETVQSLDNAGERGRDRAALFTLRAECYWKANEKENAIATLTKGAEHFPKDTTLLKQKFYYFAELKLFQAAIENAKIYIKKVKAAPTEYISLAQMLNRGGEKQEAIKILEEGKMRFPSSAKISMLLGYLYNKDDMIHTTANLFEEASYYDSNYTKDAAEMYRRAGELPHALYLNASMTNKAEKIKQQIAIFVDRGEFEKVIGLKNAMDRYGLLEDDKLRYALAYAYYVVKDYDKAERYLKQIQDNALFSKATIIRKNIEKCKKNSLGCI